MPEHHLSRKVPYYFAKAKGVLLAHCAAESAEVQVRAGASPEALAEVRRVLGVPLRATLLTPEEFAGANMGTLHTQVWLNLLKGAAEFINHSRHTRHTFRPGYIES